MIYKLRYTRLLIVLLLFSITSLLNSCITDEHTIFEQNNSEKVSLNISMAVPGLQSAGTRAMSGIDETKIDYASLQVLVFEVMPNNEERFRYSVTPENAGTSFRVKVPVSRNNEKYRFVILANSPLQSIAVNTLKEDALKQFTFDCAGKWNASQSAPTLIPMWGEQKNPMVISQNSNIHISMLRALARVDVGVLFKFNNVNPSNGQEYEFKDSDKESAWGLNNFRLKEIRVYRTEARGYAAPDKSYINGNQVTSPTLLLPRLFNTNRGEIASTALDGDEDPLLYILAEADNNYVREIYIPESYLPEADNNLNFDSAPCLVIGGYYGENNTDKITYYRADFAEYVNGTVSSYIPILRNHRYVFDIKSVSGPGFEKPEQALRSISKRLELDIIDWNEEAQNYYVQGEYFLRLETREVVLDARPPSGTTENIFTIPYETNLNLDGSEKKKFTYKWESAFNGDPQVSEFFDVNFDYVNKRIIIIANDPNVNLNLGELTDNLTLYIENFELTINVRQKEINLSYSLGCNNTKVHGKYREGVPLNYTNYITITALGDISLHGQPYEIKTVEKNGIIFKATGVFDNTKASVVGGGNLYRHTIKLAGSGIPTNTSNDPILRSFEVTIEGNNSQGNTCTAQIIMGYKTKRILAIGANAIYKYGYMLEPGSAARYFMDASVNFGTDPNSTVTMEESEETGNAFEIEVITAGKGMSGEVINYNYLLDKLNNFRPDIILTGQAINYFSSTLYPNAVIDLLAQFVDEGGVFIMCNEYYPNTASIQAMVRRIMGSGNGFNADIGYNQIFSLLASEDDPIVNGPFGNMMGEEWGADGHAMYFFTGLPMEEIQIYSQRYINGERSINMFRHKNKPFFFMGEGGFISNSNRYIGNAFQGSYVYFPFAIDSYYRPIARINYGSAMDQTINNSKIFGNIIAWAVDYSETNGIEYPEEGVNKFNTQQ